MEVREVGLKMDTETSLLLKDVPLVASSATWEASRFILSIKSFSYSLWSALPRTAIIYVVSTVSSGGVREGDREGEVDGAFVGAGEVDGADEMDGVIVG